jgi:hypothetical protein
MPVLIPVVIGVAVVAAVLTAAAKSYSHLSCDSALARRRYETELVQIGNRTFSFGYEPLEHGGYQIRAMAYPPITNAKRSRSSALTHVYSDGRICVTHPPQTLDKAKAIARFWATGYLSYIETGIFPNSGGRVRV